MFIVSIGTLIFVFIRNIGGYSDTGSSDGFYPTLSANARVDSTNDLIQITVISGTIPKNEWEYRISLTTTESWVLGSGVLSTSTSPILLENGIDGTGSAAAAGTYYIGLRHRTTGHVYFQDQSVAVKAPSQ